MEMPYIPDIYKKRLAAGLRYEMRKSYRFIGKKLGVHHTTIMRWCKAIEAGKEVLKEISGGADATAAEISNDEKKRQAIELRREGRSYRQIGDILGVHHTTVMRWYKKLQLLQMHQLEKKSGKVEG